MRNTKISRNLTGFSMVALLLLISQASGVWAAPTSVTIAGSLQKILGCADDWKPECDKTFLAYDAEDDAWQGSFNVPTGNYEYKAALNAAWTESYGKNGGADNIALAVTNTMTVTFMYDDKSHWVTDNKNSLIATAPGSYQKAIGCGGDWKPDCLRSWLQDKDGDGTYQFATTSIPAGSYEFKVATGQDWGNPNYGVDGGADNVKFTVPAGAQKVTFSFSSTTKIPTVKVEADVPTDGPEPGDDKLVRPMIQHAVENEVLYFLIPDRFANGDTSNDCGGYVATCVISDTKENVKLTGYKPSDKGMYHGGDIKGLTAKLSYLKNMGVTTIWVGPIFKNKATQTDSSQEFGFSSGYHGYWILDFMNVDPHLGTNADFKTLVDQAHGMGIKVFMDIITNHTADVIQVESGDGNYRNKTDFPYKDSTGMAFNDSMYAYNGQITNTFPTLNLASFPYKPVVPAGEENTKIPAWLNDPMMYHNRGNTTFSGENSMYGDFFGLDDLFTERKEVVEGMVNAYKFWIDEFKVDGFRIDTTKHVNIEFWQKFGPDIVAAAKAKGINDFFQFGEVYDQQYGASFKSHFSTKGKLQSTIDFGFQMAARDFAKSGATDNLKSFFETDDYYTDIDSNAYAQPIFLGNHDMGRIGNFLIADTKLDPKKAAGNAELLARDKLAHALMFFTRGQPVIYYGDEQGFTGDDGGDKNAREDMFPSKVAVYNDNTLIGTTKTTADDNFDTSHPMYQALQDYAKVYSENKALRSGAQIYRASSNKAGVFAFSRIDRDEKVEYLVVFNNAPISSTRQLASITVQTFQPASTKITVEVKYDSTKGLPNLTYLPVMAKSSRITGTATTEVETLATASQTVETDANGKVTITVPALGFIIYKFPTALTPSTKAPSVSISNPQTGAAVNLKVQNQDGHDIVDRLEVRAEVGGNGYNEVTFAVSMDGGAYTPIGTDDNPPYRVFYDVSDYRGKPMPTFSFKAIVSDLNGHINSAKVTGVKPTIEEPKPPTNLAVYNYAVIHYMRPNGDYGTVEANNYWGVHAWGDALASGQGQDKWDKPIPFVGTDDFGRFAFFNIKNSSIPFNFIIHQPNGDAIPTTREPGGNRSFNIEASPEIWIVQGDEKVYTSQAAAQKYVTIHYQRADAKYDGWGLHLWQTVNGVDTTFTPNAAKLFDGKDDYGVYAKISKADYPALDFSTPLSFLVRDANWNKDPDGNRSFDVTKNATIWLKSGDTKVYTSRGGADSYVTVHYHRPDGLYGTVTAGNYYGVYSWKDGGYSGPALTWPDRIKPLGQDSYGSYFQVPIFSDTTQLTYIMQAGSDETKDPLATNIIVDLTKYDHELWQLSGLPKDSTASQIFVLPIPRVATGPQAGGNLKQSNAIWLTPDTIAWKITHKTGNSYGFHAAADGGLDINGKLGVTMTLTYDAASLSAELKAKYPHLKDYAAFKLSATDAAKAADMLKGQIAVSAVNGGIVVDATSLQIAGVLDSLFTYDGALGVSYNGAIPTLRLWAPTAKSVKLHVFDTSTITSATQIIDMAAGDKGTWSATGDATWVGKYYLYEVEVYVPSTGKVEKNVVTDPYSWSLSQNSTRSQIINWSDAALKPAGWDAQVKPALTAPENIVLYELHVRDFSVNDATVPAANRGTFKAFTNLASDGMKHLISLKDAGLTHIHLLPSFDIATINEDKSQWQSPTIPLTMTADSDAAAIAVDAIRDKDGFNWGYDPYHYTVPEGSYSTNSDGTTRIVEFREMVKAMHDNGLRVIMDVVYNHTTASGQGDKSVLDKVVPGYYHRLLDDGTIATSTCCANTATENAMMEKLMIDSLKVWAKEYKVDGFRFDLMGHHTKDNMVKAHTALNAIDPTIYLYGEGWNFGEDVENNLRFTQATQINMAGTGIGTFSDRLRDAVRGGGPFDKKEERNNNQGFINGLQYDANISATTVYTLGQIPAEALLSNDQIMVGLAGNLSDFEFMGRTGTMVKGSDVPYGGSPSGYNQDPQEHIIYIEAHDNETLYDISQYKFPIGTSMADRVRGHNVGMSIVALSQGVPFFHAGMEMLRSKSLDRNSYNSSDWFNDLDFTYESNNWGVGLPPGENHDQWPYMKPLLANPALKPAKTDIMNATTYLQEMLMIRKSSPLFRLQTKEDIMARLQFHNTGPTQKVGIIVMSLSDKLATDIDPNYEFIVVLFNANDEAQTFTNADLIGQTMQLHTVQAAGNDAVVKTATFTSGTGTFSVPARTTVVFVQ